MGCLLTSKISAMEETSVQQSMFQKSKQFSMRIKRMINFLSALRFRIHLPWFKIPLFRFHFSTYVFDAYLFRFHFSTHNQCDNIEKQDCSLQGEALKVPTAFLGLWVKCEKIKCEKIK